MCRDAIASAVQVFGAYFLCVPTLVAQLSAYGGERRSNAFFLRVLGVLRRLSFLGVDGGLKFTDEAMWRSLLIGAGRIGGTKMAEVSTGLFSEMKRAGIVPSAITYGLYTQALAESEKANKARRGKGGGGSTPIPQLMRESSIVGLRKGSFGDEDQYDVTCAKNIDRALPSYNEEDDEEYHNLEVDGHKWRVEKCCVRGRAPSGSSTSRAVREGSKGGEEMHSVPTQSASATTSLLLGGISMWVACTCRECSRMMLEEEALSNMKVSDDALSQELECRCGAVLEAYLHISVNHMESKAKSPKEDEEPADEEEPSAHFPVAAKGALSGIFGEAIPCGAGDSDEGESYESFELVEKEAKVLKLLSPFIVRAKLERAIVEDGELNLTRERLRDGKEKDSKGELYWNFLWYCSRFGFPLPIVMNSSGSNDLLAKELVSLGINKETASSALRFRILQKARGEKAPVCRDIYLDDGVVKVDISELFPGVTLQEVEGLTKLKHILCTGNRDGDVIPPSQHRDKIVNRDSDEDSEGSHGQKVGPRRSWVEKISPSRLSFSSRPKRGKEKSKLAHQEEPPNKLPTPGKRIHDAVALCCKLRNQGIFRAAVESPLLANLYHVLLLICSTYKPAGMNVRGDCKVGGNILSPMDDFVSEFDGLYVAAVSRLTLMQHEELDQNDRDLHGDISGTRSVEFRNIFGSL